MSISVLHNSTEISDYITDVFQIPIVERNINNEPVASECDFEISQAYLTEIQEGDLITVFFDEVPKFLGFVHEVSKDVESLTINIKVFSWIAKLNDYLVTYNNLHTLLINTSNFDEYVATDNQNYPNVQILWLLKKMFQKAGGTLVTTDVDNFFIKDITYSGTQYLYYGQDFAIDENMLYCLNQEYCTNHTTIDANATTAKTDYAKNKITFFDLFKNFCGIFGWIIEFVDNDPITYRLVPRRPPTNVEEYQYARNYIINDDLKYSYKITKKKSNSPTYYITPYAGSANMSIRGSYSGTSENLIQAFAKIGNGDTNIKWYKSLYILYRSKVNGHLPGDVLNTYYDFEDASKYYINALGDYTTEEITTDIIFDKPGVLKNSVDVKNLTSYIIQDNLL